MTGFVIYALPVASGILGIAPMPGRGGHYAEDIAHMKDWKPALVITMATEVEMVEWGAGNLGTDLLYSGARWHHIPCPDMGIPGPDQAEAWRAASDRACAALRGSGRVLIHCVGGCGRSGMAALKLMVACGEKPAAALERLRELRPCAVETEEQYNWAKRRQSTGSLSSKGKG
ncbi:protein-tyrosine phosphatase family protein [Roseovarius amoyensis]|uniref:protein-tyrosine phosphatase family protein n=1 Tax=Roseovarius amoyensis TaxID=2211448 RepID=UPI000DBE1720|nr:protein-tyrosine phosphatase family protein [Roseovarius amoyensis]